MSHEGPPQVGQQGRKKVPELVIVALVVTVMCCYWCFRKLACRYLEGMGLLIGIEMVEVLELGYSFVWVLVEEAWM